MGGGCGRASSMSLKGTGQEKGSRNSQNFPSCQTPGYGEGDLVLWHQVWGTTEVKRRNSPTKFINFSRLVKDNLKPEKRISKIMISSELVRDLGNNHKTLFSTFPSAPTRAQQATNTVRCV